MTRYEQSQEIHRQVRFALLVLVSCCALAQTVIEFSVDNLICVGLVVVSTIVTTLYVLRPPLFWSTPLSAFGLLGANICNLAMPLIAQTLDARPLTFNLEVPAMSFLTLAVMQFVALGCHAVYATLFQRSVVQERLTAGLNRIGMFDEIRPVQLWIMGLLGCVALWITGIQMRETLEFGDIFGKTLAGFTPLIIAPALLLFGRSLFRLTGRLAAGEFALVFGYVIVVLLLGSAFNSRGTFATVIVAILLGALLAVLLGSTSLTWSKLFGGACVLVVAFPAITALSDLSTAMAIVREERHRHSGADLIVQTIETMGNQAALERHRMAQAQLLNSTGYNETYFSSVFVARFSQLKFHDNMTAAYGKLSDAEMSKVAADAVVRSINILPTPVIQALGLNVNKNDLLYTVADYVRTFIDFDYLGGYKSGSSVAHGFALFGVFFIPIFALLCLGIFITVDAFVIFTSRGMVIAPLMMIQVWPIFSGLIYGDSVPEWLLIYIRTLPQNVLLYAIVFHASRFIPSARGLFVVARVGENFPAPYRRDLGRPRP